MFTLKSNTTTTYKWIVGILSFVIVLLITFGVVKENGIVSVSFAECLSVAATLSSLILSIVAMIYTFWSSRDTEKTYSKIEKSIEEIDTKVQEMSASAEQSTNSLKGMQDSLLEMAKITASISSALDTLQSAQTTEQDKQKAIKNIRDTQSAMMMFLEKMK